MDRSPWGKDKSFGRAPIEKGCIINPSFLEYKIPCALDMVDTAYIDVITEKYSRDHHFNIKEVGEGYVSGTVAAWLMPCMTPRV